MEALPTVAAIALAAVAVQVAWTRHRTRQVRRPTPAQLSVARVEQRAFRERLGPRTRTTATNTLVAAADHGDEPDAPPAPDARDISSDLTVPNAPVVSRHLFGVPPQDTILVLGAVALAGGAVAVALGHWLAAIVPLLVGGVLLALFADELRRRPRSRIARIAVTVAVWSRAGARYALELVAARGEAGWRSLRLKRSIHTLQTARQAQLLRLGEAVYAEDDAERRDAHAAVAALEAEVASRGAELESVIDRARRRIDAARARRGRSLDALRNHARGPVGAG